MSQKMVNMTFPVEGVVLNFFFLVIADDATPLTAFSSSAHMVSPGFITCDDPGQTDLPSASKHFNHSEQMAFL
jgi:hypothetical protein